MADRAGGGLPLRGDARPVARHRRGQGGHGARPPDGPPGLRRCRLRQDRGRAARRLQGRAGRQAGRRPRADDDPRPAALQHLQRAPQAVSGARRAAQPLPLGEGAEGDAARPRRRRGGHRHRHAPPAAEGRRVQQPGPARDRRGAALRRGAQGAAQAVAHRGRRADADRHADPAHALHGAGGRARHERDRDAAAGAPADPDLRPRVRRRSGARGDPARDRSRRAGLLRAQPRPGHPDAGGAAAAARAGGEVRRRATARWPRTSSNR